VLKAQKILDSGGQSKQSISLSEQTKQ